MRSKIKTDISQINQSETVIPLSEYTRLKQQIKQVKYPTYAFSQAEKIGNKINNFSSQKVRNKLFQQLSSLNSYRKVRGDGNCFFRALAFSFIAGVPIPSYYNCFEYIDQIKLDCCYPDSIPKMWQKFYDNKFLQNVLKQSWEQIFSKSMKQSNQIKNKALLKLFDQNPFLDFIIVLYFRAVCLKALYKFNHELENFLAGGEEASIRTYSEQTEGISIKLCSKILNITIFVFEVRKDQIHSYHYDASKISNNQNISNIALLYYENHYDILENNPNIEAEKSVLKKKSTYYDEVDQKLIKGVCIECRTNGYVYEESKLCLKCHEANLATLNQFKKQKFVKAFCQQCRRSRDDVSTSFGLCTECINFQNQIATMKNCSLCNRRSKVDEQTLLCMQCLQKQKQMMNHMQSSKKFSLSQQQPPQPVQNQGKNVMQIQQSGNEEKSKIRDGGIEYDSLSCRNCYRMKLNEKLENGLCKDCKK